MNKPISYHTSLAYPVPFLSLRSPCPQPTSASNGQEGETHSLVGVALLDDSFKVAASAFSFSDLELYFN